MPRILGQERALQVLTAAMQSGRFHHAWIFSGPHGVGKFTTAMEVARILLDCAAANAKIGSAPDSNVQQRISAGMHPDLHVIRKELALFSDNRALRERKLMTIPLDLLRERLLGGETAGTAHEAAAYRTAAMGMGKVFIIDEAELLAPEAQNAMLKTLEEPPQQTWFFLITTQPERLLPTIQSRCQHVRFQRLDEPSMQQWWREVSSGQHAAHVGSLGAERETFDPASASPAAVQWSLRFAEGSPGLMLLALRYGFHEWHAALQPMLRDADRGVFPVALGETLGSLVEGFAQAWVVNHGRSSTSKDAANKDGARHVLSLLGSHARQRLRDAVGDVDAVERWATIIDLVQDCERQIRSNVNQKLAMENLAAQWTAAMRGELIPACA